MVSQQEFYSMVKNVGAVMDQAESTANLDLSDDPIAVGELGNSLDTIQEYLSQMRSAIDSGSSDLSIDYCEGAYTQIEFAYNKLRNKWNSFK